MARAAAAQTDDADRCCLFTPRAAYDLAAPYYEQWRWQEFWRRNEWPLVRNLAQRFTPGAPGPAVAVDLGTGPGTYLNWLGDALGAGWARTGIDLSAGMLALAQRHRDPGLHLVQADVRGLPIADGAAGLVLMNRVASHIDDLGRVTAEIARILGGGCHAIVTDVAPEHAYVATELPTADGKILVTTVKHSVDDWRTAAALAGMSVVTVERITAANAAWLPADGLRSIDRAGRRPIAFALGLRKRA